MALDPLSFSSAGSGRSVLAAAADLLELVEHLPPGATGALAFGGAGVILVASRRICWTLGRDMRERLTDILCKDDRRPLPRHLLDDVFRHCKANGTPLGETLVSSGLVSEVGLRSALTRLNAEGIVRLARAGARATAFSDHARGSYDPRFTFTTTETLAAIAALYDPPRAALAREHLATIRVEDAFGVAFVRDLEGAALAVMAADRGCPLRVAEALEIGAWVSSLLDVAATVDAKTTLVSSSWCDATAVVAWHIDGVSYAELCSSRPASALLVNQVASRLNMGGVRYSGTMAVGTVTVPS